MAKMDDMAKDLWVCPQCRAALPAKGGDIRVCSRCAREYARIEGVWSFVPDSTNSEVMRHFDRSAAQESDDVVTTTDYGSLDSFRLRKKTFSDLVPTSGHALMLDVGCGGGDFSKDFAVDADVYGVDISLNMARRAAGCGLKAVQAQGEHLPFADNTFDLVYCLEALQYIEQPAKVLEELVRVTKRGSFLVVSSLTNSLLRETRKIFLTPHLRSILLTHAPEMFAAVLKNAGVEIQTYCFLYQPTRWRQFAKHVTLPARAASTAFYIVGKKI